tara:strand:- start:2 stop:535 length:534 start_codon:yes stop_codon:yes gene_type:complete
MPTTESIVTAVNNSLYDEFLTDDGTVSRLRDGDPAAICTAFGNLSIPAGATIDGIEVDMEGYAANALHDAIVGDWIYVSNDGGSSFSTAQSVTTGTWSTNSGAHAVETAGGTSELWGETWNATTAAAIQVKLTWSTTGGDAVYLDYVKVRITYTAAAIPKSLIINGVATINGQLTIK